MEVRPYQRRMLEAPPGGTVRRLKNASLALTVAAALMGAGYLLTGVASPDGFLTARETNTFQWLLASGTAVLLIGIIFSVVAYAAGRRAGLSAASVSEAGERQKTATALQAERQRMYDVLETLPVFVVLLAPDYRIRFANRVFEDRFGKPGGRRCYEVTFSLDNPCEKCETRRVLETNAPRRWEWAGPDRHHYDIHDFP